MSSSGTATIWTLSMVVYSSSGVASMTVPISGAILIKVSCFDVPHKAFNVGFVSKTGPRGRRKPFIV